MLSPLTPPQGRGGRARYHVLLLPEGGGQGWRPNPTPPRGGGEMGRDPTPETHPARGSRQPGAVETPALGWEQARSCAFRSAGQGRVSGESHGPRQPRPVGATGGIGVGGGDRPASRCSRRPCAPSTGWTCVPSKRSHWRRSCASIRAVRMPPPARVHFWRSPTRCHPPDARPCRCCSATHCHPRWSHARRLSACRPGCRDQVRLAAAARELINPTRSSDPLNLDESHSSSDPTLRARR